MESIWQISLIVLWGMVLALTFLVLRIVRWLRAIEDQREVDEKREHIPLLETGAKAPMFRARYLHGTPSNLDDFSGQPVVFLFLSPHCGGCRRELPSIHILGQSALNNHGVEFVIVSDSDYSETQEWLNDIQSQDKLNVDFRVIVAPRRLSTFVDTYNPRGLIPYFCAIDPRGIIVARDPIGRGSWSELARQWRTAPSKTR